MTGVAPGSGRKPVVPSVASPEPFSTLAGAPASPVPFFTPANVAAEPNPIKRRRFPVADSMALAFQLQPRPPLNHGAQLDLYIGQHFEPFERSEDVAPRFAELHVEVGRFVLVTCLLVFDLPAVVGSVLHRCRLVEQRPRFGGTLSLLRPQPIAGSRLAWWAAIWCHVGVRVRLLESDVWRRSLIRFHTKLSVCKPSERQPQTVQAERATRRGPQAKGQPELLYLIQR